MRSNAWPPSQCAAEPLHLALRNRLAALEPARQAVLEYLAPCALSPRLTFAVELILEETFVNAVTHAFGNDASEHLIDLRVRVRPDDVVLHFEDDGVAFDPTRAREPEMPASIAQAVPGGRGVMLVRRFAKAVSYERNQGRNHLTIEIARNGT